MLFCFFVAFWGKFKENFLFSQKSDFEIFRKFVFLTMFEKGKILKNLDLLKQMFLIKPVKGDKY